MNICCQIWIVIFGCAAVWFVGRREQWSRWGYVLGLLSQPAWFYTAWHNDQWGIAVISCWYTYSWAQGILNHYGDGMPEIEDVR